MEFFHVLGASLELADLLGHRHRPPLAFAALLAGRVELHAQRLPDHVRIRSGSVLVEHGAAPAEEPERSRALRSIHCATAGRVVEWCISRAPLNEPHKDLRSGAGEAAGPKLYGMLHPRNQAAPPTSARRALHLIPFLHSKDSVESKVESKVEDTITSLLAH